MKETSCLQVFFDGDGEQLRGKMCTVSITDVHAYTLYGHLADTVPSVTSDTASVAAV